MSNWRNEQNLRPKTWEDVCKMEKDDAFCTPLEPQNSYAEILVFPCGYTDPLPISDDEPHPNVKPAKSKRAKSNAKLPGPSDPKPSHIPLPIWAPRDYKRLQLEHDFLPVNASEWQIRNLFQQIHEHYGDIGAHVFTTSGLQGVLPTTRWPFPPESDAYDTYYIVRMKDTRKKKILDEELPVSQWFGKAFVEFLIEHKNNYCAAWRIRRKRSEIKTAKWCAFSDHNYLLEEEPFKGNVVITNYDSGYSWALNEARVWKNFFVALFDFLYELYDNPKSETTGTGYILFQTLFMFFCEGKRFPAIERFNRANWKKREMYHASCLTKPLNSAVNVWSDCSDLILLLAIVLEEDDLAKRLMAMKPNAKDPKLPHYSLVQLFDQFLKHRIKAQSRCKHYTSDIKGLHSILRLEKDKIGSSMFAVQLQKDETGSFGFAAFERLTDHCLNLLMFNHDLVLALKARKADFQGLLGVNIGGKSSEKVLLDADIAKEKPAENQQDTETSSAAAGVLFPQDTRGEAGFKRLLEVDIAKENPAEKQQDTETSSAAAGGLFPQYTRGEAGFKRLLEVDIPKENPTEKLKNTDPSSGAVGGLFPQDTRREADFQGLLQKDRESSSWAAGRNSSSKHSRG